MISSIVIVLFVQEIDGILRNIPHRTSNDRFLDPCKAGWKTDLYFRIESLIFQYIGCKVYYYEETAFSTKIIFIR